MTEDIERRMLSWSEQLRQDGHFDNVSDLRDLMEPHMEEIVKRLQEKGDDKAYRNYVLYLADQLVCAACQSPDLFEPVENAAVRVSMRIKRNDPLGGKL